MAAPMGTDNSISAAVPSSIHVGTMKEGASSRDFIVGTEKGNLDC